MINIIGATDKGNVRAENQDIFAHKNVCDHIAYAIVCDGVGGEKAGSVASNLAATIMEKCLDRDLAQGTLQRSVKPILQSAIQAANVVVHDLSVEKPIFSGMGTTMDVAVIFGRTAHIIHVGDSRIYMSTPGQDVKLITHDHTFVQNLIDNGELSPDEAPFHPQRHYITRAIGINPSVDADYLEIELGEDDVMLLCSDGLSNYIAQDSISGLIRQCVAANDARPLVDYALAMGGTDNITAVIVNFMKVEQ